MNVIKVNSDELFFYAMCAVSGGFTALAMSISPLWSAGSAVALLLASFGFAALGSKNEDKSGKTA